MDIKVIPINTQKYLAFTWGKHLIFLDSLQFLNRSLHKLAANLRMRICGIHVKFTKIKNSS